MSQQEKDQLVTPVIFRYWKNEVIALFPSVPGSSKYNCSSYMHVGQHSSADDRMIIAESRPATPQEYADLKIELENAGYTLKIYRRWQYRFLEMREDEIARIDLAYGLENGEMYSWGVWGYTPFRIARHSRWCGGAPANYSEESPDFYRAVEPNTQREEWKRFDTTDEALEYMASVTRLSNWRKVQG